ncbi:uncharacterized protein LOC143302180 [Babylonia areolata]|uniref:uncharacterized protein LOC143302180 n=1 Tax=Babylonia areolata TaxID=304850 RepID=UPI003FCFE238
MADEGQQVAGTQWWAPPKLPHFSGESADGPAEDFIAEVSRVLEAYRIANPVAVDFIIRHLQGKARREVLAYTGDEINTPQKVLEILRRTFGDSRPLTGLMSAFHGRRQAPGQSVLEFAQELRNMEARINERDGDDVSAEMLRDRFIEGLTSAPLKRELRRLVRERDSTTFCTIRDEALRWTREEGEPEDAMPAVFQHQLVPQPSPEVMELRRQLASLTESVQAMQTAMATLQERTVPGPSPVALPRSTTQAPVNDGRCYYCQKLGHIKRDCRKRKRDEQQNRPSQGGN